MLIWVVVCVAVSQPPPFGPIIATTTIPVGSCSANQGRLVGPGGTIYTCQNGTWGELIGGSPLPFPRTEIDSSFANITLACDAVGSGGTVILTQSNPISSTQTLDCNLQPVGGSIKPASGTLIRHSGRLINADTSKVWDMSGGGHVDYSQNTVVGYVTQWQFGAACDGSTNDTTAFNETFRSTIVNQAIVGRAYTGVRLTGAGTCMVSNVFATLNAFPSGCYNTGTSGCYSPAFVSGEQGNRQETSTITLKAIAASTGYVFNAQSTVLTGYSNLSFDGNATENCMKTDWPDNGPSLGNKYQGIRCSNYTTKGLSMGNQNDSVFDGILVDGTNSGSTAYAFSLVAPGGSCYALAHFNIAIGKAQVDCQDGVSLSSYYFNGVEIGLTSINSWVFIGGQIEKAPDTNVAVNSTYTMQNLVLNAVALAPSGLSGSGAAIFKGGFLDTVEINGGNVNFTGGSLFGAITTNQSGYNPSFNFHGTWSFTTNYPIPSNPSGTSGNWVIYDGVNHPSDGTIMPYLNTKDYALVPGTQRHVIGTGVFGEFNSSGDSCVVTTTTKGSGYYIACAGGDLYLNPTGNINFQSNGTNVASLSSGGLTMLTGKVLQTPLLGTVTSCASVASPAVCGASSAGIVQIAAGATSLTINTTAITGISSIGCLTYSSAGISAPSNAGNLITPYESARVNGTSFTLTVPVAPLINPINLSYCLVN